MSSFEEDCKKCIEACKKCYAICKKKDMPLPRDMCLQCISVCKLLLELINVEKCTIELASIKLYISACKYCIKECGKHRGVPSCIECVNVCKTCVANSMNDNKSGGEATETVPQETVY